MKLRFHIGWLAALALTATPLLAQDNQLPVSRTTGVLNVDLPINKATFLALPLANIVASGTVSAVSGTTYTLASSPASLPDVLTAPHAIKIISRNDQRGTGANAPAGSSTNAYGYSASISAQSGQDVTAALAVAPNVGDEYVIYALRTLGSLFSGAALNTNAAPASADTVYLSTGGGFVGYFNDGTNFKLVSAPAGASQDSVVVAPGTAVLVSRLNAGTATSIRFTGVTLAGREAGSVSTGYRMVNNPFSVATTLEASGIRAHITGGTSAGAADLVYLENNGVLTAFFFKTGGLGGTGWRTVTDPASNQGATIVRPGKAILFKEQAGTVGFALPEPFAE